MASNVLRIVLFLSSFLAVTYCRQLPSFIKPCKRNDPQLDQCLIRVVNNLKPKLAKGIPEMRIPPLDPLQVPLIKLDQGSEAVNFKATFRNFTAYTGVNFDLTHLKLDFDKPALHLDIFLPLITFESLYTISGKVLVVPISGDGICKGNFSKVSASLILDGKYVPKHGKNYLSFQTKKLNFKIGNLVINFDNLFGGKNKALGKTTNEFINQNWKEIIQELNPLLEETIGKILISIIRGLLELYAVEDFFPST